MEFSGSLPASLVTRFWHYRLLPGSGQVTLSGGPQPILYLQSSVRFSPLGATVDCAKTLLVTFLANSWQPIFMGHTNCAEVAHDFGNLMSCRILLLVHVRIASGDQWHVGHTIRGGGCWKYEPLITDPGSRPWKPATADGDLSSLIRNWNKNQAYHRSKLCPDTAHHHSDPPLVLILSSRTWWGWGLGYTLPCHTLTSHISFK